MSIKAERIHQLRRGIASESTPESLKESMEIELGELLKPEPPPQPIKLKKPPIDLSKLPHAKYMVENNVNFSDLPVNIRKKINGLRMFMGKDSDKIRLKGNDISEVILVMIKSHLNPPPPPKIEREFTKEEKENIMQDYKRRKLKRKESEY